MQRYSRNVSVFFHLLKRQEKITEKREMSPTCRFISKLFNGLMPHLYHETIGQKETPTKDGEDMRPEGNYQLHILSLDPDAMFSAVHDGKFF